MRPLKHLKLPRATLSGFFALFLVALTGTAFLASAEGGNFLLITGASVRVRSTPATSGAEVGKLRLGEVVEQRAKSAKKEKIGKMEDFWFQVRLPDGKDGWVFGGFARGFAEGEKEDAYLKMVRERIQAESANPNDWWELWRLIESILPSVASVEVRPYLELARLQALQGFLNTRKREGTMTDFPQEPELQDLKTQMVYSEPAGQWMLERSLYMDLYERNRKKPAGDEILWVATNSPMPGETEGFAPAVMQVVLSVGIRYLEDFPKGRHSEGALKNISEWLKIIQTPLDKDLKKYPDDLQVLKKGLEQIEAVMKTVSNPLVADVLKEKERIKTALSEVE